MNNRLTDEQRLKDDDKRLTDDEHRLADDYELRLKRMNTKVC